MKLTKFEISKTNRSFKAENGTVNNKTTPTSETVIDALCEVLYDMYQQQAERETVKEDG